jgi:aminoglycoside/choline kinase family phosphotransferase
MSPDPIESQLAALVEAALSARLTRCEPLAAGLGTRRFFRLTLEGGPDDSPIASVIARVEPPEGQAPPSDPRFSVPAEPPLEPIRAFLEVHAIPVPRSFGADTCDASDSFEGIALLEDVGATNLEDLAARVDSKQRRSLYREACELIPRLQALEADLEDVGDVAAFGRRLDAAQIASKAEKFITWAAPWLQGREASVEESRVTREAFAHIAQRCSLAPARLAHRDYKAANIHVQPEREVGARLSLIDLQGAFLAPPEYDLVCLLRDSHVALPEDEVAAHLAAIRPRLPDAPAAADFDERFDLLTLCRVCKDVAHYIHAATDREDERYLRLVPTAMRNLAAAAQRASQREPQLEAFCAWIESLAAAACAASGGP